MGVYVCARVPEVAVVNGAGSEARLSKVIAR